MKITLKLKNNFYRDLVEAADMLGLKEKEVAEAMLEAMLLEPSMKVLISKEVFALPEEIERKLKVRLLVRQILMLGKSLYNMNVKEILKKLDAYGEYTLEDLDLNVIENKYRFQFEYLGWSKRQLIDMFVLWLSSDGVTMLAYYYPDCHPKIDVEKIMEHMSEIAERVEEVLLEDEELGFWGEVNVNVDVDEDHICIEINTKDIDELPTITQLSKILRKSINEIIRK